MMDIETFLDAYGLIAIFGIMLAKAAGIPIPIPADALMLATSARVATGRLSLPGAFVALLIALSIGGVMQFSLVRRAGRSLINRFGRYLGLTPARIETTSTRLQKSGTVGIGVAILTPGVRSVAVIACGLAGIPLRQFVPGLVLGSGLFLALHFILGYIGGSLLSALGSMISPPLLIAGIVILLAAGLGVWYLIRRRQLPQATSHEIVGEALGAWHEATCPVCLALGAAGRLQIQLPLEHKH